MTRAAGRGGHEPPRPRPRRHARRAASGDATLGGRPADRLAGLIVTGPLVTLVLALLAAAYGRPAYLEVALVLALLSFAGL